MKRLALILILVPIIEMAAMIVYLVLTGLMAGPEVRQIHV